MGENAIALRTREHTGKGVARKLRAAGRIPGILYGPKIGSVVVDLETRELERILREAGSNALLDLAVEGRTDLADSVALVKESQRHPVRGHLMHVDLYQVDLTQKVEVGVPVSITGRSQGVENGGILDVLVRELLVSCLPRAIPESLEIDVTALEVGDAIHAGQVTLPADVELVMDSDLAVVHVVAPAVEETPEEEVLEGEEGVEGEGAPAEGAPAAAAEGGDGGDES